MKMRTFLNNKLWRDKLIAVCESQGSRINWRYLSDIEYDEQLRLKLLEEGAEVAAAQSRNELIGELADVFEVIDSLCMLHGISRDEIVAAQQKKNNERGGFAGRKFVETVEHPAGSPMERYCLAQPAKYPEIIKNS